VQHHDPLREPDEKPAPSTPAKASAEAEKFNIWEFRVLGNTQLSSPEIERVVLLREGRILADGPKEEILTAERLTDLFGVPVQLVRRDGYFHSV